MKTLKLLIIFFLFLLSGCYAGITGRVIDAETEKPIEGAVVLVEWTKTHGLGLTYTESYKVFEGLTDKEGMISIPGTSDPFVNPPHVTVYKKGYVAWNNEYVFPNWKKREDFKWDDVLLKLHPFKKEYLHSEHVFFLHSVTHWGKLMQKAYQWEELEKEKQ